MAIAESGLLTAASIDLAAGVDRPGRPRWPRCRSTVLGPRCGFHSHTHYCNRWTQIVKLRPGGLKTSLRISLSATRHGELTAARSIDAAAVNVRRRLDPSPAVRASAWRCSPRPPRRPGRSTPAAGSIDAAVSKPLLAIATWIDAGTVSRRRVAGDDRSRREAGQCDGQTQLRRRVAF